MSRPTREQFHAQAVRDWDNSDGNVIVQSLEAVDPPHDEIVDVVEGGAWVMGWLWVSDEEARAT